MTDIFCNKVRLRNGWALVPAHGTDEEAMKKLPSHQPIRVTARRMRNVGHHRKYFALLNYAFDCWEPENEVAGKSFDRFRKDIVILCGFYDQFIRLDGSTRLEAKSISFASMDQEEFEELYSKTIDVIIKYVLRNYTRDDLEAVIDEILEFDA